MQKENQTTKEDASHLLGEKSAKELLRKENSGFLTIEPIIPSVFASTPISPHCGGVNIFLGIVRNHHEGKSVKELFYDCYAAMAEKQLAKIIEKAKRDTGVEAIKVLHRIGRLQIGEVAVAIMAGGAHRDEAFRACRQVIDDIKEDVPIWKKETYEDLTQKWVLCTHHEKRSSAACQTH